jgi:hypothetical protein
MYRIQWPCGHVTYHETVGRALEMQEARDAKHDCPDCEQARANANRNKYRNTLYAVCTEGY